MILCVTLLTSQMNMISAETVQNSSQESTKTENQVTTSEKDTTSVTTATEKTSTTQTSASTTEKKENETTKDIDSFIKEGKICIYNYEQLKQIGTGKTIYTGDKSGNIGAGDIVKKDGKIMTYQADGDYLLMNDIVMDTKQIWNISDSFTGTITGEQVKKNEELYNKEKDTIYIYNPYQLMVLTQEDSEKEPVMSLDYEAKKFGMGQMIYPNGTDKDYLTYSKKHNYVLSVKFNSYKPKLEADQVRTLSADDTYEGRDFNGQVVKTIGNKKYILIGNEEQLRKIGSGDKVYGAVYQAYHHDAKWNVDEDSNGKPIMLYGGDADLKKDQNGTEDYKLGADGIKEADKSYSVHEKELFYFYGRCGVDQTTGKIDPNLNIDKAANVTYASNANYIIFRDIKLTSNWTPLMFSGNMIGAKETGKSTLWKNDSSVDDYSKATDFAEDVTKPVISDVVIEQSEKINVGETMGVGFFATLSSETSDTDIGISKGTVNVSNIQFHDVKVETTTSETYYPSTLVSTLTSSLGKLLGAMLSGLTWLLTFGQVKIDLGKTLGDVLDARKKDPTALATGGFAGRVVGDVHISKCELTGNVSVSNVNNNTGSFVGYTEGSTQYSGLSNALGDLVKLLSNILNVIPGLGLGDLITILLGNAIPLSKLIPTGYKNVKITECNVSGLTGILGNAEKDYAGGFVGQQIGTIIENSNIQSSNYKVVAKTYAGGFSGLSRDAVIEGTLSGALDTSIQWSSFNPESLLLSCSINSNTLEVSGENSIGGFVGAMANTSAVNCTEKIDDEMTISNSGDNTGGFVGLATIGWAANLGKEDNKDNLLGAVVDLVTKLLSSDPNQAASLLSLGGINPSAIMGCQITAPMTVQSKGNYSGGLVGRGDGAYVTSSKEDYLKKVSFWRNKIYETSVIPTKETTINGLKQVTGKDYVGGVTGSLGTASVAGLLNTTVGIASYLSFTLDEVTVSGNDTGYQVVATGERAGGVFGEAIGGTINAVTANNLYKVEGNNLTGGFGGLSGPGDLAGTDNGLTVNLLGLNHVLKLSNLLSLGQAVEVKISDSKVLGVKNGYTVKSTGAREDGSVTDYIAGGFLARSNSTKISACSAQNLKDVTATDSGGYAGGFLGVSKTGGLADVADEDSIKSLVDINGLVNAVSYLIPKYTDCSVHYVEGGGVSADTAGGFAGDFQSGTINNKDRGEGDYYCVYNLDHVTGKSYAGGFGGNVYSGALASAGKGISILGGIKGLNINIGELLNLINAYIPYIEYAGVKSEKGFTVTADQIKSDDSNSGSAGGFIGYGSGVQVSHCDVNNLKHTKVTAPKDLEEQSGSTYFDTNQSAYAVTGARYAGGYIGYMDIGSAASIGKGLSVLGTAIGVNDVLDALNVVVSTIEHSDVTGNTGGFAVKASNVEGDVLGDAGGFAGKISGGHIQDSNANNFSYIIGQIAAGGYVGDYVPGDVASVLGDASILNGLVSVKETLASVAQDFVPTIRNSSTSCIPCGGAVRAQAASTESVQRGMAGGYVGHNEGGHIWGSNTKKWKGKDYTGSTSNCQAIRIRSVYGAEIAGGFTGFMECADTASTGSLSLLWGLVKADNLLGALSIVYPTEENTDVYGPLAKLDVATWNSWVKYVGKYGGYGSELAENGTVKDQTELDKVLSKYEYGYQVVAGRDNYQSKTNLANGGAAGGYVGSMHSGTITNGQTHLTKEVKALRTSGGFAGEVVNTGAANLGSVSILGLNLELGQMLNVLDVFVPVIKKSSVEGYQSGLSIKVTGTGGKCGYAGGYTGHMVGGQIWGDENTSCQVKNLRRVDGTKDIGGFVGNAQPGSVASVDTTGGSGLLNSLINSLIKTPADLIKVLDATVSTIRYAGVTSYDDWGVIINGAYANGTNNTGYARSAGGFAGSLSGTVLGEKGKDTSEIYANGIRSVIAGEYAGGGFGIADVDAGVQLSAGGETNILGKLLQLGKTDVLDAFRTYVYYGSVSGSKDHGLSVVSNQAVKSGQNDSVTYSGNAGGFGGALLNGSVKNSKVTNLLKVKGLNSVGGFVGYSGKSGVVDLSKIDVLGDNYGALLGGSLGVLDVFGSVIHDSQVTGYDGGYTVQSENGDEMIAGGFIGYANLARIADCKAGNSKKQSESLKQVSSGGTAGGFVGRTSFAYLADVKLDSQLVDALLSGVLNPLVKALYLDKIQESNLLNINLGILKLQALYDGKLIHLNLLGLDLSVGLSKKSSENDQQTDLAIITIGDSTIKLPCDSSGIQADDDAKSNISISLIKANRTKIKNCEVDGISSGYDVYAGGADNDTDGIAKDGNSGGFVGYNDEGYLLDNDMYYCDVVRGSEKLIGPFSGKSKLDSAYAFNTLRNIEGENNTYRIYRKVKGDLNEIKQGSSILNSSYTKDAASGWSIYSVGHMKTVDSYDTLKDAKLETESSKDTVKLNAYISDAKAVLMADTKTTLNTEDDSTTPEPSQTQDPCDELINLTINKVWRDNKNQDKKRPDNITVTIQRTWTENGVKQTETVPGYESYQITGDKDKSTWQELIKGLPAYKTVNDEPCYYKYSVTETEVNDYETDVKTSDDGFTTTITNSHFSILPDTGGWGQYLFYLIGILLLGLYIAMRRKKRKEQQQAEQLYTTNQQSNEEKENAL